MRLQPRFLQGLAIEFRSMESWIAWKCRKGQDDRQSIAIVLRAPVESGKRSTARRSRTNERRKALHLTPSQFSKGQCAEVSCSYPVFLNVLSVQHSWRSLFFKFRQMFGYERRIRQIRMRSLLDSFRGPFDVGTLASGEGWRETAPVQYKNRRPPGIR